MLANNAALYSAGGLDSAAKEGPGEFCRMGGGGEWWRLRSLRRNMLWLCHISIIDIEYTECRCAGGTPRTGLSAMNLAPPISPGPSPGVHGADDDQHAYQGEKHCLDELWESRLLSAVEPSGGGKLWPYR